MNKMKWIRYRTKWSAGPSSWDWLPIPYLEEKITGSDPDKFLDVLVNETLVFVEEENNYSEHFRGVEWEFAEVPADILDNFIKNAEATVRYAEANLLRLKEFKETRSDV